MQNNTYIKHKDHTTRQKHTTAVASKLVRSMHRTTGYDKDGNKKSPTPPLHVLNNISERSASVQRDIESIEQLLPDIKLAKQILISSILSPKDMGVSRITFSIRSSFPYQELGNTLIRMIDNFFTDDYKINETAPQQLEDILFTKGSYPELILPESEIDGLINQRGRVSLESCKSFIRSDFSVRPLGLLTSRFNVGEDNASSTSLESMFSSYQTPNEDVSGISGTNNLITVVDNPDVVKVPTLLQRIHKDKVAQAYSRYYTSRSSLESRKEKEKRLEKIKPIKFGDSDKDILDKLDTNRHRETTPFIALRHGQYSDRETVGHPLTMLLPHEAVIPAHTPGNPKDHVGYFLLLDQMGNFISSAGAADYLSDLRASFNNTNDENSVSSILREMKGVGGMQAGETNAVQSLQEATTTFAEILEIDLLQRLRGQQAGNMSLARVDSIYQIMLARLFANQRTQLLYVPVEYLNYMAFNYTSNGTGKSLLEETRILASMRVMLMFANTMSAIRNSTAKTRVAINFDPVDTDPLGTAELVKSAFMRARSQSYPLGEGSPVAMMEYLNQAGVDVVYSGHPDLPDMSVDISDEAKSRTMVDRDLEDQLRRQHIMGLGLSPEMVDITSNVEFATTVINSSLMFAKQVALYQKLFCHGLEGFITRYTRCSQPLTDELKSIIDKYEFVHEQSNEDGEVMEFSEHELETITDEVFDLFLESIDVNLPAPDTITLTAQMEAFREYSDSIDQALDAYISIEMQEVEGTGDYGEYVEAIRLAVKAIYQRRWLRENNVFTELDEIVQTNDQGDILHDLGKEHHDHLERIMKYVDTFIQDVKESTALRDRKHTSHDEELEERFNIEETDDVDTGDAGVDDMGDGGDDFNFDDESDADDFTDDGSEGELDDTQVDAEDDIPGEEESGDLDEGSESEEEPEVAEVEESDVDTDTTTDSDDENVDVEEDVDDPTDVEELSEDTPDEDNEADDTSEGESEEDGEDVVSDAEPVSESTGGEGEDEDTGLILDMDMLDDDDDDTEGDLDDVALDESDIDAEIDDIEVDGDTDDVEASQAIEDDIESDIENDDIDLDQIINETTLIDEDLEDLENEEDDE